MQKHKGYQEHLESIRDIGLRPFVRKLFEKFPLLNLLTPNDFSFIPYELLGRTVYIIARKP